jgi:tetratricopeptide (TPR) repeat protein
MQRDILIHIHIFKNAGTSFDFALREHFGEAFVDHRDDRALIEGRQEYLVDFLDKNPDIKAFSSHSIHFIPQDTDRYRFIPVYFLRHPIERIRSVYSFEKKQRSAGTEGSKKAKELGFDEYIEWYMRDDSPATIRNAQTIFLSGDGPGPHSMEKKFEIAKERLAESDVLIGVVDRYDDSMIYFEEKLKSYFPDIDLSYIRKNITDDKMDMDVSQKAEMLLERLNENSRELVLKKNGEDIELYEMANDKLERELGKIDDHNSKKNSFKLRCALKKVREYKKEEKYDEILDILSPFLEMDGLNNIHLYLELGKARQKRKEFEEAVKLFKKAAELFPRNPWPCFYEIEICLAIDDKKEAKKLLEKHLNKLKKINKAVDFYKKIGLIDE